MKEIVTKNEMINRIKYNTSAFGLGGAEYLTFEAKWKTDNSVYFKMKSIVDYNGKRHIRSKKGCLNYDNSKYFLRIVNDINFKKFKKDSVNVNSIVYDGENNTLKVKTDKYCERIHWQTCALKSKYISNIKTLVRICTKYKEPKEVIIIR